MKVRTQVILVMAMIAALLATSPAAAAQSDLDGPLVEKATDGPRVEESDVYEPLTDREVEDLIDSEMGYWIGFRRTAGFDSTREAIAKIARDQSSRQYFEVVGVPLTKDEYSKLGSRVDLRLTAADLERDLKEASPDVSSVAVDDDGLLTVAITDERAEASVRRSVNAIEFREVVVRVDKFSADEVRKTGGELAKALSETESFRSGNTSTSVSFRKSSGGLLVRGFNMDIDEQSELRDFVAKFLSPDIKVELQFVTGRGPTSRACWGRGNCGSGNSETRGGLTIHEIVGNSTEFICTSGFMFTDPSTLIDYVSTAGHCDDDPDGMGYGADVLVGGQNFAAPAGRFYSATNTVSVTYGNNLVPPADAVMIEIPDNKKGNRIYKWSAYKAWYINKQLAPVDDTTVCVSGAVFLFKCGPVTDESLPWYTTEGDDPGEDMTLNDTFEFELTIGFGAYWTDAQIEGYLGGNSGAPIIGDQTNNSTKRAAIGTYNADSWFRQGNDVIVVANGSKIANIEFGTGMDQRLSANDP